LTALLKNQGIPETFTPLLASVDAKVTTGSDETLFHTPGKIVGKVYIDEFFKNNAKEFQRDEAASEKLKQNGGGLLGIRFAGLEF
jgi:hypothetical protein